MQPTIYKHLYASTLPARCIWILSNLIFYFK